MNNREVFDKYIELSNQLIAEMNEDGFWTGRLATSALSTAVAIVALKVANNDADNKRINTGCIWLCQNINTDGGYGDTTSSVSNVSTTLLCYAAVKYCQTDGVGSPALMKMEKWLAGKGITFEPKTVTSSILKFYGKDYTFSIPILSMLILCGVLPSSSVEKIPALPFELTLFPPSLYRFFNLRVVSYALPALIGVGIFLHRHRKKGIRLAGSIRSLFIKSAIEKLNRLVPQSGGFLEAVPLTGFVSMCLIASGETENITVIKGVEFLRCQQRENGGWPIDTDLSTWVTTLSVKALGSHVNQILSADQIGILRNHLLKLQYKERHPFNGAKPGGWGWTNYSGSVPDGDDTPGAILALLEMHTGTQEELLTIEDGCKWLVDLQNTDGGFPTFCKGWGKLPFDKSCSDLTGHALLALLKTLEKLHKVISPVLLKKVDRSINRAKDYLAEHQSADGAWLPLWFGNQFSDNKTNPVYGTSKVCIYLTDCLAFRHPEKEFILDLTNLVNKAQDYLLIQQNMDGSWGGKKGIPGSIEETSLAVCALVTKNKEVCLNGINWIENQEKLTPAPIGLYFALLWYHEKMYPLICYTDALRRFSGF
jgi:squalene-hopene/tetraprenyl-beta-curcumene cyclase